MLCFWMHKWKNIAYYFQLFPDFNCNFTQKNVCLWMVYSLVDRARGLEYGGREFKSRGLHLKPETEHREERGLSGCRKGLKTVPLAQALLSLKPAKTRTHKMLIFLSLTFWVTANSSSFGPSVKWPQGHREKKSRTHLNFWLA